MTCRKLSHQRPPGRYLFGPERVALIAAQLPATDAAATAERDTRAAALRLKLKQNDTAKKAQIIA